MCLIFQEWDYYSNPGLDVTSNGKRASKVIVAFGLLQKPVCVRSGYVGWKNVIFYVKLNKVHSSITFKIALTIFYYRKFLLLNLYFQYVI